MLDARIGVPVVRRAAVRRDNRTDKDALYLEVGTRSKNERVHYPDVDFRMERDDKGRRWMRKSGEAIKE